MTAELIVTSGRLKAFIHEAMTRLGLPDQDAAVVAERKWVNNHLNVIARLDRATQYSRAGQWVSAASTSTY